MVKAGARIGTLWVIDSGLKAGEHIVVEGLQKVKAGTKVKVETVTIDEGGAPDASGK
jgi:membrane fusion protein (multidrug efflux system)